MTSPLAPARGRAGVPTAPSGQEVASYETYAAAQAAVDFLSDEQFPVQHVTIVGTDLRMVERVLGRLTYGRVAGAGFASGAWIGLLIGLILFLFSPPEAGFVTVLPAVLIGGAFGLVLSLVSYGMTRGRRDFTSVSQIVASRYALFCAVEQVGPVREVLGRDTAAARGLSRPTAGAPTGATTATATGGSGAAGGPEGPASSAPAEPDLSGPTYSEMLARRREEERARDAGEAGGTSTSRTGTGGTDEREREDR